MRTPPVFRTPVTKSNTESNSEHGVSFVEYMIALAFLLVVFLGGFKAMESKLAARRSVSGNVVTIGPCGGVLTPDQCK